ncbi:MAG: peptidoglycan-binding domain-containing protein [Candidatus Omnitrophota bacterium]
MKKAGFVILALMVSVYLFGCGKKQQAQEIMPETMSIETLSTVDTKTQTPPLENKAQESQPQESQIVSAQQDVPRLEKLPPPGPYKPTTEEIQKALKNAGYYAGVIDGKKGPKTKKAIEDFQRANSLEADGRVGPKTWVKLKVQIDAAAVPIEAGQTQ